MSPRRKHHTPAQLVDRFDTRQYGTYDDQPVKENPTIPKEYNTTPAVTFTESMEILQILMKDYQSKHYGFVERDAWYQVFPFAWYDLEINDEIKNLDTGEIYRVEQIVTGVDEWQKNAVKLKGKNPPRKYHNLRLDDKKLKYVRFIPAYPDSEAKPYEFDERGYLQNNEDQEIPTWGDTITYTLLHRAPGSRSDGMFSGSNIEYRPKDRTVDEDGNPIKGMKIDNRIRLDFWTKDNKSSELLREWFQQFYLKYYWLLEANGLSHFMWTDDAEVKGVTRWREDIIHRSSVFEFRTEYSIFSEMFKIRSIKLEAVVPKDPTDTNLQGETIKITVD